MERDLQWNIEQPSARFMAEGVTSSPSSQEDGAVPSPLPLPLPLPVMGFWFMGLLNNMSYVIMIASAKNISEGGTGLVFIACVLPSLTIKLTAPYWFDRVGYSSRIAVATVLMVLSFATVASFSSSLQLQLVGVAMVSAQCGMGEASLLALAGRCDSKSDDPSTCGSNQKSKKKSKSKCITAFSSGTGLAGVMGFLFHWFCHDFLGCTLGRTLLMAQTLPIAYAAVYYFKFHALDVHGQTQSSCAYNSQTRLLSEVPEHNEPNNPLTGNGNGNDNDNVRHRKGYAGLKTMDPDEEFQHSSHDSSPISITPAAQQEGPHHHVTALNIEKALWIRDTKQNRSEEWNDHSQGEEGGLSTMEEAELGKPVEEMSPLERMKLVLSLWPYMVPLFLVYAAEYALQAGTWTAIGFPADSQEARNSFYQYSNWLYQAGVFVSRSSGTCLNVVFFTHVGLHSGIGIGGSGSSIVWYYSKGVLFPCCFYVGLLGGGVYVNGFTRICADVPTKDREFALASVSVAESFGIVLADVTGLWLQSCIYKANGIPGAIVSCPLSMS
eukprot:scaffold30927_cov50-Attheya_sp.AAC.1